MSTYNDSISSFLRAYAQAGDQCDLDQISTQFASEFIVADPDKPQVIRIADFIRALPYRRSLFDRLGCTGSSLESFRIHPLTTSYALVTTTWKFRFARPHDSGEEVVVDSSLLIHMAKDGPQILVYLPHQDIMKVLRERGILKDSQA
jgi:hypothetical protein